MFRVQFGGSCREEVQEHCCSCVHKLSQFLPVQAAEEQSLSQDSQAMDTEHAVSEHTHTQSLSPLPARAACEELLTALRVAAANGSWEIGRGKKWSEPQSHPGSFLCAPALLQLPIYNLT